MNKLTLEAMRREAAILMVREIHEPLHDVDRDMRMQYDVVNCEIGLVFRGKGVKIADVDMISTPLAQISERILAPAVCAIKPEIANA